MAAAAASKSAVNTTLMFAGLTADIGIFSVKGAPGSEQRFDTGGPNGGKLVMEKRAIEKPAEPEDGPPREVPVADDAAPTDPLAISSEVAADRASMDALVTAATQEAEYRNVLVEEGSGEEVAFEDVRKGVRLGDGRFIDCTDQVDAIEGRTKLDRMEIVAVIDATRVYRERVIGAYEVGAQRQNAGPVLRLLYEALGSMRRAAVVKYTTRSRQSLGVIVPNGKRRTLMLLQLIFADDLRESHPKAKAIQQVEVKQSQVDTMVAILGTMSASVEVLDEQKDEALSMRAELRARAEAGEMDAFVVEPLPEQEAGSMEDVLQRALAEVHAAA